MSWKLTGEMYEACSCKMICPCTVGPAEPDQDWCSVAQVVQVASGESDGVDLSGARVALGLELPGDFFSGIDKARLYRGGPHPLDRFSSQLRWNPIHDSSCFVCWLSSSPSVSVRFLRRPAVERRVGPAPVVEVHPQADSSPGLGASSELGQVDALVFE